MSIANLFRSAAIGFAALAPALSLAAAPRVEFELVEAEGFPLGGSRKWIEVLRDLDLSNLRIRGARPGDRAAVELRGDPRAPIYHVTGMLSARNTLQLPAGSFTLSDRAGIAVWIARLRDEGVEGVTAERGASFGLTHKQFAAARGELAVKVAAATQHRRVLDVVRAIADSLTMEVAADPSAQQILDGQEAVADELMGLSSGTALAAALRPLGLAATLEKTRGAGVRLLITDARRAPESWPVGWPSEKAPRELVPGLFKFLPVTIDDVTLAEALTAIGERVAIPFLLDYNSLARHRVDVEQVRVSLPGGRMYYQQIIGRLLSQAKLKSEIRVDEAERPFLWISTIGK